MRIKWNARVVGIDHGIGLGKIRLLLAGVREDLVEVDLPCHPDVATQLCEEPEVVANAESFVLLEVPGIDTPEHMGALPSALEALVAVEAYLQRELADDPAQADPGCEIGALLPLVRKALGREEVG